MSSKTNGLVAAVPSKGRLREAFMEVADRAGLRFEARAERCDLGTLTDDTGALPAFKAMQVRPSDALTYMQRGYVDIAVVGLDVLTEFNAAAFAAGKPAAGIPVAALDAAQCSLMIAARKEDAISSPQDLEGLRIATSFPATLEAWLRANEVMPGDIVTLDGGVEASIGAGAADAICDLVESGNSLRANGLEAKMKLFDSSAVIVRTTRALAPEAQNMLMLLARRLEQAPAQKPAYQRRAVGIEAVA
jgi:ATP phosphoribosyltransferase